MSDFDNTNTGVLFKNEDKQSANHPDYKGSVNVNGQEFWLSAWIKPLKKDPSKRFMSISVKPKESKQAPKQAAKPAPASDPDFVDSIPF